MQDAVQDLVQDAGPLSGKIVPRDEDEATAGWAAEAMGPKFQTSIFAKLLTTALG